MEIAQYLPPLLEGVWMTVQLTIYSTILGATCSFLFGMGKLSGQWYLKIPSVAYVEVFRGTSLLVQMYWLYFALPLLGIGLSPLIAGVLALGLNIGAYGAEVVRGSIQAVAHDQYDAAKALNFTPRQTLFWIALPQALVEMMPPFGNLAIQNLKDTALVSLITLGDLTFRAQNLRNLTQDSVTIYSLTLFLYFALALVLMFILRLIERRVGIWTRIAGGR